MSEQTQNTPVSKAELFEQKMKPILEKEKKFGSTCLLLVVVLIFLFQFLVFLGNLWPVRWEYKTVRIETKGNMDQPAVLGNAFIEEHLNKEMKSWELVGTITENETVFPNFGDENYVAGIQSNTRSYAVILLFKKRCIF